MNALPSELTDSLPEQASSPLADLAALHKACGDELRLEILRVLRHHAFGVLELCGLFDMRQPAMSHHLKVLAKAGLVETQREGNTIFYRRAQAPGETLEESAIRNIYELIDQVELSPEHRERMREILAQRAELSRAFFARHADRFQAQQELIATYDYYAEPALEVLLSSDLPAEATVLEIGPGEGAFLDELAPRFGRVIALDTSDDLLARARERVLAQGWRNVEFVLGDTAEALQRGIQADAIVMNMVLHHVPAPAALFEDCQRLLRAGGVLILTDLCHHDQSWVKERCGDLWLGFEPADLSAWAQAAGFEEGTSLYIGVRNGFQVQIRQFFKPEILS